jgi:hypothetical protein
MLKKGGWNQSQRLSTGSLLATFAANVFADQLNYWMNSPKYYFVFAEGQATFQVRFGCGFVACS